MSKSEPNTPAVDMEQLDQELVAQLRRMEEQDPFGLNQDSQVMKLSTPQPATDHPPEQEAEGSVPLIADLPNNMSTNPLDYLDTSHLVAYLKKMEYLLQNGIAKRAWRQITVCGSGIPSPEEMPVDVANSIVEATARKAMETRDFHLGALAFLKRRMYHGSEVPDPVRWASVVISLAFMDAFLEQAKGWAISDAYSQ